MKENIGFDLDGVCYPWQEIVHAYCYSHNITTESNPKIFWTKWKVEHEDILTDLVNITAFYDNGTPYTGLLNMLERLSEKYNIYYITSRPSNVEEITAKYLFAWGFPDFQNLIFTKDKPQVIKALDIKYYVEDRVELAVAMHPYTKVFLVDKPYNESFVVPNGMTRIKQTIDVERYL